MRPLVRLSSPLRVSDPLYPPGCTSFLVAGMVACGRQVVSGRARVFLLFRFIGEEAVEVANLVLSVLQLAACPGFYPSPLFPQYYETACWLFFGTSVCSVLILTHSLLESRHFLLTHAGQYLEHQSHEQLEEIGA